MKIKHGVIATAAFILFSESSSIFGAGVTIITHGWDSSTKDWVTGMAYAISTRPAGASLETTRQTISITRDPTGDLKPTVGDIIGSSISDSHSAEIILLLDWSSISGRTIPDAENPLTVYTGTGEIAASVAPVLLSSIANLGSNPVVELPIHIIGHSRGASLAAELARLLGKYGIWVDQLTTLDPHPICVDVRPVQVYENVLFADNYYETDGSSNCDPFKIFSQPNLFFPNGSSVSGAYNRRLVNLLAMGYPLGEIDFLGVRLSSRLSNAHSNVHLWYHGTINSRPNASDGEQPITDAMRNSWYDLSERGGSAAGYLFSRLGGGNRQTLETLGGESAVSAGYNFNVANGHRVSSQRVPFDDNDRAADQWPNIITFTASTDLAKSFGEKITFTYSYQCYAGRADVTIGLDSDSNPYNGGLQTILSKTNEPTGAAIGNNSETWSSSGVLAAQYWPFAKVTANGHTRYLYAQNPITFTDPTLTLSIIDNPRDSAVFEGQSATFSVKATGIGPIDYRWRRNGTDIPGPSASAPSYTTSPVDLSKGGDSYDVRVSNSQTFRLSREAILTVLPTTTTTLATPKPTATTGSVSQKTATTGTLTGEVNPNGVATTAYFEYGLDSSLTNPKQTESLQVGSGTMSKSISASINNLAPNTPYHYRVVATNAGGTTKSPTSSFTTDPSAPGTADPRVTMQIDVGTTVNFGTVPAGSGAVSRVFVISNDLNVSSGTLVGSVGMLASPFTVVSGSGPFTLQPGQSRTVAIEFSPQDEREYPQQNLFISHNAGNLPANPFPVIVRGTGGARLKLGIELSPNPIVFDNVQVGGRYQLELVVRNPSSSAANLSGNVSGLVSPFEFFANTNFGLGPGDSTQIYVVFRPSTQGEFKGDLTVTHNAGASITIPVIGRTAITKLHMEPASINFGEVVIGETVSQRILLWSEPSSTASVQWNRLYQTGDFGPLNPNGVGPFSLQAGPGDSRISPGQTNEFRIAFSPFATGQVTGKMVITHVDEPDNPFKTVFTGIGVLPAPARIFGRVTDSGGSGIGGVTITVSGTKSPTPQTTTSSGSFSFENLSAGGNFTVTPSKSGFTFSPPKQTLNSLSGEQSVNFIALQPPVITSQPQGRTVVTGDNVSFSVSVTGTEPLQFQWFVNGSAIPRASSQTLSLTKVQESDSGTYTVLISNMAGAITSNTAILTVNPPPVGVAAPTITEQPQSQNVTAGGSVTFRVTASASSPINYQWLFNGSPIQSATSASLTLNNVQAANSGSYSVTVSNAGGSTTSQTVTLTVTPNVVGPSITAQPQNQSVTVGGTANFAVGASGTEPLSYQWQFNGTPINGANSSILTLSNVQQANAGTYTVRVSNSVSSVTSTPAILTVNPTQPSVTINQAGDQADPTSTSPIKFTIIFSESVTGFNGTGIVLSGTAGASSVVVAGSGTTYTASVTGMTQNGTVIASVRAGAAQNTAGSQNTASTSGDNTVTFQPVTKPDPLDTWHSRTSPTANVLHEVHYANGLWVAVGNVGTILNSQDGLNWTLQNSGTAEDLLAVTFANGKWIAVGTQGTILSSTDTRAWTSVSSGTSIG